MIRPVFRTTLADWVGLNENIDSRGSIFPNPVGDHLNLQLPQHFDACHYRILDVTGACVLEGYTQHQPLLHIQTSQLSRGCYIIHYSGTENAHHSARFVKE